MNIDIFTLYIFSRYSCLSNICENIYIVKITFIMPHRGSNIKNTNTNLRKIANFRKSAKNLYTQKYLHSQYILWFYGISIQTEYSFSKKKKAKELFLRQAFTANGLLIEFVLFTLGIQFGNS